MERLTTNKPYKDMEILDFEEYIYDLLDFLAREDAEKATRKETPND